MECLCHARFLHIICLPSFSCAWLIIMYVGYFLFSVLQRVFIIYNCPHQLLIQMSMKSLHILPSHYFTAPPIFPSAILRLTIVIVPKVDLNLRATRCRGFSRKRGERRASEIIGPRWRNTSLVTIKSRKNRRRYGRGEQREPFFLDGRVWLPNNTA